MTKAISIRMYNVGFGDSFLLRFPGTDRERKVLIDCGVHASGPGPHPMSEVVDQIIQDVSDGGKPAIDLVIATHRHRDHVLGFESAKWQDVEVGEVWMPWTGTRRIRRPERYGRRNRRRRRRSRSR
jgi:glyoxylase-like metal-dependent hydrolase (beta-lactamase superfamily II)